MIPFNKPCQTGDEVTYLREAIESGHLSGGGAFTRRCHELLQRDFGFEEVFLTPSCTAALEMSGLLCDFREGDEIILPSFAHVGTANPFVRAGAKLVLADSLPGHPNIDPASVESLLSPKTRAIVVIHYAGMGCQMEVLKELAQAHGLSLIEDAAHALGASYGGRSLGSWGDYAAFSFHETKNVTSGLGGLLVVNRPDAAERARQVWQQGTNRHEFERGAAAFYTWVQTGGAFQMSDLNAAYLYAQLSKFGEIGDRRMRLWQTYYDLLQPLEARGYFRLPEVPAQARHNAHIFYLLLASKALRDDLLLHLNERGYQAVFHYVPLHMSPLVRQQGGESHLPNCERVAEAIIRLPLFDDLRVEVVAEIVGAIDDWQASRP